MDIQPSGSRASFAVGMLTAQQKQETFKPQGNVRSFASLGEEPLLNSYDRQLLRTGAIAAMLGPLVLIVSTLMHPLEADPNDAVAAFTEYAADRFRVVTHLGQFLGVAIIVAALVMLSRSLEEGKAAACDGVWRRPYS